MTRWQALEYVSFAPRLQVDALEGILCDYQDDDSISIAELHREYFALDESEAVVLNKDQRIVIVGQRVSAEIRQTASYLCSKGIAATCVEFTFFEADGGERLLSLDVVVGTEFAGQVAHPDRRMVNEQEFQESCDEYGRGFFSTLLDNARRKS